MPDSTALATNFKGLLPAFDPRQVERPYVVEGRNFLPQTSGPRSYWGSKLLDTDLVSTLANAPHLGSFKFEDTVFYFDPTGVFKYVDPTGYVSQFTITGWNSSGDPAAWSYAFVGNKHYIYNPNLGQQIIQFDPLGPTWSFYTNVTHFISNIQAITQSLGRLVILGQDSYQWSAQDDATDLDPAGATGAGSQGLSLIGGDGIFIDEYKEGVLVYTTAGVIQAIDIGDATLVFRHDIFSHEVKLVNSFSHVSIDDEEQVVVTARGLYKTSGESFVPYRVPFNQYLVEYFFKIFGTLTKLHYCPIEKSIFFSAKTFKSADTYDKCFVLTETLEEWGSFNRVHYCTLFVDNPDSAELACTGYCDIHGMLSPFTNDLSYQIHENSVTETRHLDSYIKVGPFRFRDQEDTGRLIEVEQLVIGMSPVASIPAQEDWNVLDGAEDWNVLSGEEDWGLDISAFEEFTVNVIGTFDGKTIYTQRTPQAVDINPGAIHYSVYPPVVGIYFLVEIFTDDLYDSFQGRTLELSGKLGTVVQ